MVANRHDLRLGAKTGNLPQRSRRRGAHGCGSRRRRRGWLWCRAWGGCSTRRNQQAEDPGGDHHEPPPRRAAIPRTPRRLAHDPALLRHVRDLACAGASRRTPAVASTRPGSSAGRWHRDARRSQRSSTLAAIETSPHRSRMRRTTTPQVTGHRATQTRPPRDRWWLCDEPADKPRVRRPVDGFDAVSTAWTRLTPARCRLVPFAPSPAPPTARPGGALAPVRPVAGPPPPVISLCVLVTGIRSWWPRGGAPSRCRVVPCSRASPLENPER